MPTIYHHLNPHTINTSSVPRKPMPPFMPCQHPFISAGVLSSQPRMSILLLHPPLHPQPPRHLGPRHLALTVITASSCWSWCVSSFGSVLASSHHLINLDILVIFGTVLSWLLTPISSSIFSFLVILVMLSIQLSRRLGNLGIWSSWQHRSCLALGCPSPPSPRSRTAEGAPSSPVRPRRKIYLDGGEKMAENPL